jgi:hypothetical protein
LNLVFNYFLVRIGPHRNVRSANRRYGVRKQSGWASLAAPWLRHCLTPSLCVPELD